MRFRTIVYTIVLWLLAACFAFAQQLPKPSDGTFAIINARLITVTGDTIDNGALVIADGKIGPMGINVPIPADAEVIDCAGLTVYPGLIDAGTRLGLSEVGSISLTQDYNEIGEFTPHMQALTAVNPNAVAIPVTRTNGVTTVLTQPAGSRFPGTAALINLVGYTPEQMYAGFKGVIMNFPSAGRRRFRDDRSNEEREKEMKKNLEEVTKVWDQAVLYHRIDSAAAGNPNRGPEYNPGMEALLPVVRGEAPLLIEVDRDKDILAAINWTQERKIPKVIFTGVAEGWRVADSLAAADIPVITGPVLSTPSRASDRYDRPYANAGLMFAAGVKVAIRTNETENVRNLPFNAGFAATYGMGSTEALRAITIVPAEMFGLEDQLGSLEEGKVANLFVADGDPFETKTEIKHLFISGYKVPLTSRHTDLYREFLDRNPGLRK